MRRASLPHKGYAEEEQQGEVHHISGRQHSVTLTLTEEISTKSGIPRIV